MNPAAKSLLASSLDHAAVAVARWFNSFELRAPLESLLVTVRRRAAHMTLARHRPAAASLLDRLACDPRDAAARAAFSALAEEALGDMRREVERLAAHSRITALAAGADALWHAPDLDEYLDDEAFDHDRRVRLIADLDRFNVMLGSYEAFYRELTPLLDRAAAGRPPDTPLRVLDLAAGHGGFALWAAARARAERRAVRFTVSDLKPEYLALGRARAEAADLPIDFLQLDVHRVAELTPGDYEVIMCTQALHHFPAGLVAATFADAQRVAGSAVLFIDGARTAVHAAPVAAASLLFYRNPALAHDAIVSLRRFYTPDELGLLCQLGAGDAALEVAWRSPGHCVVRG